MALTFKGLQFLDDSSLTSEELKFIKDILNPENAACVELPWDFSLLGNSGIASEEENTLTANSFGSELNFISPYTLPSQHVPLSMSQSEITPPGGINAETGVPIPIVPPCVTYAGHPTVPYPYQYPMELSMTPGNVALTGPDMVPIQQIQPEVSYASHLPANQEATMKQRSGDSAETILSNSNHSISTGNKYPKGARSNSEISEKGGVLPESVPMVTASSIPDQLSQAVPSTVPFMCTETIPLTAQGPGYPRLPSFSYQTPHQVIYAAPIYNFPYPGCIPSPASTIPNTTTMASPTNNEWVNSGHNVLPVFAVPSISASEIANGGWTNNEQNRLPNVTGSNRHVASPLTNDHYNEVGNPPEVTNECKNISFVMDQKSQINTRYESGIVQSSVDGLVQNEQHASATGNSVSSTNNDDTIISETSKETKPSLGDNSWNEEVSSRSQSDNQSGPNTSTPSVSVERKFTWADLFKEEKFSSVNSGKIIPPASSTAVHTDNSPVCTIKDDVTTVASVSEDEMVVGLRQLLHEIEIDHTAPCLKPRGLINRRNWCYINATLQALLACPPFYNLLKSFPTDLDKEGRKSCTPIMDSLVKFVHEFPQIQIRNSHNKDDFPVGPAFEPIYIYKMLSVIKSVCVKGQQEDAEEFLSCILNGLHEEMLAVMKGVQKNSSHSHEEGLPYSGYLHTNGSIMANGDLADDSEDEAWQLIGPKNKSMVTRTATSSPSPISDIFGGQIRSILTAANRQSAFIQPFFTLQLDIQAEKVDSVSGALSQLIAKEPIQGYTCAKTKQEVEAFKSFLLEKLPPIFILHFKRFVYDKDGGSKKVVKKTDYPIELELGKELLSHDIKRLKHLHTYKLIAVVYHDGEETVKGHYVADIFHCESDNWLRCDDRNISVISEAQVLRHSPPRVPYLLFYRNVDTIRGPAHSK